MEIIGMRKVLINKVQTALNLIKSKSVQINTANDFLEEVEDWVKNHGDEEYKEASIDIDFRGIKYSPNSELHNLQDRIFALEKGFSFINFDDLEVPDLEILLKAMSQINENFLVEVEKASELANGYADCVEYGDNIDLDNITLYNFEKPK